MPEPLAPVAHHTLSVRGRIGALDLSAEIAFTAPWTVLYGPSGSGKSSFLRGMCGLQPEWEIVFERSVPGLDAQVLQNTTIWLPPERRHLAYAPQQAALFPHLSVRDNIAFAVGLRGRRTLRSTLSEQVIGLLHLEDLLQRYPRTLSGGERQRVALARAMAVPDARLLLLDEPFAGVDKTLRDELLPPLRAWCAGRDLPVVSVTHDVDEVFLLQAEVVRLKEGRVVAQGAPGVVLADEVERVQRALQTSP